MGDEFNLMKGNEKNQIKEKGFWLKISICVVMFLLISLGIVYANNTNKGELNGDGKIDYTDVSLLEEHLIHSNMLPEDKIKNADMNGDNQITVTDLTLLVKKIERTIDYEVEIKNIQVSNYYPNKNEEITLSFDAKVSYGEIIKTITINGKDYEIADTYEITVNAGNTSGVKEYKFEKATLINGEEIKLDNTVKIDVLKTQPQIENWAVTEDTEKSELNISFNIIDSDKAIKSGEYKIAEKDKEGYIQQGAVVAGTNNINVKVKENTKYQILVEAQYNLDTDTL